MEVKVVEKAISIATHIALGLVGGHYVAGWMASWGQATWESTTLWLGGAGMTAGVTGGLLKNSLQAIDGVKIADRNKPATDGIEVREIKSPGKRIDELIEEHDRLEGKFTQQSEVRAELKALIKAAEALVNGKAAEAKAEAQARKQPDVLQK